jgi:hypothetical protein
MPRQRFLYTEHARTAIGERAIRLEWVERVVANPEWIESDAHDPTVTLAFAPISEFGGRILRVVYYVETDGPRIVTAYFDRSRRSGSRRN